MLKCVEMAMNGHSANETFPFFTQQLVDPQHALSIFSPKFSFVKEAKGYHLGAPGLGWFGKLWLTRLCERLSSLADLTLSSAFA